MSGRYGGIRTTRPRAILKDLPNHANLIGGAEHKAEIGTLVSIRQGQQIRLAGQGHRLGSGRAGDLFLQVEFKVHPIFRVEGRDIYLTLRVAPWEAALGASVKVPTPSGTVEMKIPANSAAQSKLRLKGRSPESLPATSTHFCN
ncbi:MAG: curved DNA-binding protein [Gammaproteobacteria bacterium]